MLLLMLIIVSGLGAVCSEDDPPLLLIVSLDGFRWDYLTKNYLPNFERLKNTGSYAEYIFSTFGTHTFPNHWTLVTGLNEESHGIVHNTMFDPILGRKFSHVSRDSHTIEWFGQNKETEPIWTTNQKAGKNRRSAAEWVGSNLVFSNEKVTHVPYEHSRKFSDLVDMFVGFFTRDKDPINFGAVYFDEPDFTGHIYGPDSNEMKETLKKLDTGLGYLVKQLKSHNLFDKINLIVTSDHGMETITSNKTIVLDNIIDLNSVHAFGSFALYNLFVKKSDLEWVYNRLKQVEHIDVYKRDEIPGRLHYKNNPRVGDIIIVAHIGYSILLHKDSISWPANDIRGNHGFYAEEPSMYSIFIGHGPGFKRGGHRVEPFYNVDVYILMCKLLGIKPRENNGTLANVLPLIAPEWAEKYFYC